MTYILTEEKLRDQMKREEDDKLSEALNDRILPMLSQASSLNDLNQPIKCIKVLMKVLRQDWAQLADSSTPDTFSLQIIILKSFFLSLTEIQDADYEASGMTAVCASRSQLLSRLIEMMKYHSILLSANAVITIYITFVSFKFDLDIPIEEKLRQLTLLVQLHNHKKGFEHVWHCLLTELYIDVNNDTTYKELMKNIPDASIRGLLGSVYTPEYKEYIPPEYKEYIHLVYITSLICDLGGISDDFLFQWSDEYQCKEFVRNKYPEIIERLITLFPTGNISDIPGILNIGRLNDGRKLIEDLCKEFNDFKLEVRPPWLISDSPTAKDKSKTLRKEKTITENKNQTTLARSVNETQPENLSEGFSYFDPSVTFKTTITYFNKLNKPMGIVPNEEINDHFCLEMKLEPEGVFGQPLVDGTNMVEKQWYHARFYEYNPLDNTWRYHPHVIRLNRKVNLGSSLKGTFRHLLEVEAVGRRLPVAGKIFRLEHSDSHRVHVYVADIRCQTISLYFTRKFTAEFGHEHYVEMVGAVHVHVFQDNTCRKIIEFFNVEFRAPEFSNFIKLTNNADYVNKNYRNLTDLGTAFSHYTYLKSEEKLLVVDLQGWTLYSQGIHKLMLTDPCIHAPMWEPPSNFVGNTNISRKGIDDFWKKQHRQCNDICRRLGLKRPKNY